MDDFSGYNQIQMTPEDEKKIVFITDHGFFCYKIMSLSLKNIGATYQRLVNKIFKHQIGQNMKAYVDGMLVKSHATPDHIVDLWETFNTLSQYKMRLNPAKYAFGVTTSKFLGFMVLCRGIKVNLEKIKIILEMTLPKTIKKV